MNYEKFETLLKECRNLLRLINCEVVIDISDENLFNMLFQSEDKKKVLLTWLIQQIYSSEICTTNSFEDLVCIFIPKKDLQNFLSGNMPTAEQYKRWKLIMSTLYRKEQRKSLNSNREPDKEIETGTLLEKYECFWNEKVELKYLAVVSGKVDTIDKRELEVQLERAKSQLNLQREFDCTDMINVTSENKRIAEVFQKYKNSNVSLNEILAKYTPKNSLENMETNIFNYNQLDKNILNSTKLNMKLLHQNINTFSKVIKEVEHLTD